MINRTHEREREELLFHKHFTTRMLDELIFMFFSDHLKIHLKTHDNRKPFQCTLCNRGYGTAAALTSHMQNHKRSNENSAQSTPPGTIKCHKCSEVFREPEELQVG